MLKYYRILGLQPGASRTEIKKAYYTLAKTKHPDVNKSPNAEEEFITISIAYKMLTNPRMKIPVSIKKKTKTKQRTYSKKKVKKRERKVKSTYRKKARMRQETFIKKSKNELFANDIKYIFKRSLGFYIPLSIVVGVVVLLVTMNLLYIFYSFLIVAALVGVFSLPMYFILVIDYLVRLVKD